MKSSVDQLRQRGYATPADVETLADLDNIALREKLTDASPVERTAAVHLLARRMPHDDPSFAHVLLDRLAREKCLYTRLELCAALENGGWNTALAMLPLLGYIGGNQYERVGKPSRKRTYPLPRDIIARSLGRMEAGVLPLLLEVLENGANVQVREVIDAIGYMIFHHRDLAAQQHYDRVILTIFRHQDDSLIIWKCLTCLSAFPAHTSAEYLTAFMHSTSDLALKEEAERSLSFIENPPIEK